MRKFKMQMGLTGLILSVSSMMPGVAAAQAEGGAGSPQVVDRNVDINEIVVTANKREQNLNDVGLTVTALGEQALKDRRVVSLEDVANVVPGLIYAPSSTNTPIFTLRGVGFNENSLGIYPAVSIYMDQVPLSFGVLASHSAYDLERVEVLKGPQGTLFGQNSTGGAINYIAAKPTDTLQVGGDISYGRFNQVDANAFISGPLAEGLNARLSVTGLSADGWQKSVTRPGDTNGKQEYYAGRLQFEIRPSDAVTINLSGNAWQDKSEPQAPQLISVHERLAGAGAPATTDAAPVNDPLRNYISPPFVTGTCSAATPAPCSGLLSTPFPSLNARSADWSTIALDPTTVTAGPFGDIPIGSASTSDFTPYGDRKFWQLAGSADIDIGALTLTSLTSYVHFTQDQRSDGDGSAVVAFDLSEGLGKITSFTQELRLANDPTSALRWVVGGNFEKSKTFEDQLLRYQGDSNYSAPNFYINATGDRLSQDIRNYAVFGNVEFDLTPELTLRLGGRYTNSKIDAINSSYTIANGNPDKILNLFGLLSGLPFDPPGPDNGFSNLTLNTTVPLDAIPDGVTINSPQASGAYFGLGVPGIPFDATLKEDNFSWRVGLDYKASDDVLLYANVSRGYKTGSFPVIAALSYITELPVTQESVTAYEAGIKASLADGVVQFNAAGFYYDYKDKQVRGFVFDPIFGSLDTLINVPKSRIFGLEADVTLRPLHGLTINLAGTYLDSNIKDYFGYDPFAGASNANFDPAGDNREDLSGNPLPYTPKWSGSFNVDYYVDPGNATPFFGITVNARSSQDASIAGGTTLHPVGPRYRVAPGVSNTPYTVDGYATLDARLGYEGEDGAWRVMVWGKNVFNKYYWTGVSAVSDSTTRYAGKPATYGVTLAFKY